MNKKIVVVFLVIALMFVSSVCASGLSVQLKRTNPGIAGEKSAELIFDVVNTDFDHMVEGFIWCKSPDDAVISSTLGVGSGSGAQYISPKFTLDYGPSQQAMSIVLEADSVGDKNTGCTVKYASYKEVGSNGAETKEQISYEGTIGLSETDVSGYKVSLISYVPAVESVEATDELSAVEAQPEKVKVTVNNIPKEIEVGSSAKISDLTVEVVSATEESADVKVTGEKTNSGTGTLTKQYKKMNGQYVNSLTDGQYSEIRLDKTVPFVSASASSEVECPEGKSNCKASEVDIQAAGWGGIPVWAYILGILLILFAVFYLFGKSSK
jgi:hypothetical protein